MLRTLSLSLCLLRKIGNGLYFFHYQWGHQPQSEPSRPYSREPAAYPLPWLREKKLWPAVSRIDDGKDILTCLKKYIQLSDYINEQPTEILTSLYDIFLFQLVLILLTCLQCDCPSVEEFVLQTYQRSLLHRNQIFLLAWAFYSSRRLAQAAVTVLNHVHVVSNLTLHTVFHSGSFESKGAITALWYLSLSVVAQNYIMNFVFLLEDDATNQLVEDSVNEKGALQSVLAASQTSPGSSHSPRLASSHYSPSQSTQH